MYTIKTFTFVGGKYVETVICLHSLVKAAAIRMEWALNLDYLINTKEDLHRLLRVDEMGLPIPYRVRMPGYEDQPPTYLIFTYTPE